MLSLQVKFKTLSNASVSTKMLSTSWSLAHSIYLHPPRLPNPLSSFTRAYFFLKQERDHEAKTENAILETRLQCEADHANMLAGNRICVRICLIVRTCWDCVHLSVWSAFGGEC